MSRKPSPPSWEVEELEQLAEKMTQFSADLDFDYLLDKLNFLVDRGQISAFSYSTEILSFIGLMSVKDPNWVRELSEINARDKRSQPTVTIPVALLGPILEGWAKYREAEDNLELDRAMGVKALGRPSGQGLRNDRDAFNAFELDEVLAQEVLLARAVPAQEGRLVSLDDALRHVAGKYRGYKGPGRIGLKRIRRAHAEHGRRILKRLEQLGLTISPPTS